MEMGERSQSHRTTRGGGGGGGGGIRGGDLFVCFPSRTMPTRLRSSTRGGAGGRSPAMFPSTAAEPSSPKVTCIGQVRVKTSRRRRRAAAAAAVAVASVAGMRSRRSGSFRRVEERSRHQSWGHLPLRVVRDALRSFGSEVNCCFRTRRPCCRLWRKEKVLGVMVVEEVAGRRSRRTRGNQLEQVAGELQRELAFQKRRNFEIEEEVGGEVQAPCVPPKNALLLMRYRSDPCRVTALQSRLKAEVEEEEEEDGDKEREEEVGIDKRKKQDKLRVWHEGLVKVAGLRNGSTPESMAVIENNGNGEEIAAGRDGAEKEAEEEEKTKKMKSVVAEEVRRRTRKDGSRWSFSTEKEMRRSTSHREGRRSSFSSEGEARWSMEKEAKRRWSSSSEKGSKAMAPAAKKEKSELPECLLLMMYEPKLSMEVSKETWVSKADFLRWEPHLRRQRHGSGERPTAGGAEEVENKADVSVVGSKEQPVTESGAKSPPAASCDDGPTAEPPMKKVGSNVGDGVITVAAPFALTRCKSEPTRLVPSSSSPDGCFWKSMPQLIGPAGSASD